MHDVFISYSHKDKSVADAICANLEANSVRCWYAPRDIAPGDDWSDAIMNALSQAKVFILIFSRYSNVSQQVKNEITSAAGYGCKIIPFCIDNVKMQKGMAYYLNSVHWLDATDKIDAETIGILYEEVYSALHNKQAKGFVPVPFVINRRIRFKTLFLSILTVFLAALLVLTGIHFFGSSDTETYTAKVGDIVTFGTNNEEPIEWRVIDEDGDRILVVSTEGVYSAFYNFNGGICTWEACSLRGDLNGMYYDLWFTEEEKSNIYITHLENYGNEKFGVEGGSNTRDYIFILSLEEVLKYFPEQESRELKMSGYISHSITTYSPWWLRNPGRDLNSALYVDETGNADYETDISMEMGVGNALGGVFAVRPAMWIKNEFIVKEKPTENKENTAVDSLKAAVEGDIVQFGRYEQDNNTSNGAEKIDWIVLETEQISSLKTLILLSKDCIDEINITSYNHGYDYWYSSVARAWLNDNFYFKAFNEDERQKIISLAVDFTKYENGTASLVSTADKVFLLSVEEYNKYSPIDAVRDASVSDYAYSKNEHASGWWLRDMAESTDDCNYVVRLDGGVTQEMQKFGQYLRPVIILEFDTDKE